MFSVGIDIQDIEPFREKPYEKAVRFHERIFTEGEIKYSLGQADPAAHFAARFAAKEAVMKIIGPKKIFPSDIEVVTDPDGKPEIVLLKDGLIPKNHRIQISLSHTGSAAAAVALLHPI